MTKVNHIGIIVDGNGRWAKEKGKSRSEGHKAGAETLEKIMAENCGKSYEQLHKDCERDNFLSAEEACAYGLVDKVIAKR